LAGAIQGNYDTPVAHGSREGALREAASQSRVAADSTKEVVEAGAFIYEWGDNSYSTGAIASENGMNIDPVVARQGLHVPAGATLEGFAHAHPASSHQDRLYESGTLKGQVLRMGKDINYAGGAHTGDTDVIDGDFAAGTFGRNPNWVEAIVAPDGQLEFYYPRTQRLVVVAPLGR
jgi:hypothetical protein